MFKIDPKKVKLKVITFHIFSILHYPKLFTEKPAASCPNKRRVNFLICFKLSVLLPFLFIANSLATESFSLLISGS